MAKPAKAPVTLHIGTGEDGQRLPHAVMTMTSVILAKKGAGKTNTAVVIAEEVRKVGGQVGVVDPVGSWWGIKSSADGESVGLEFVVFGGDHADLPLEPDAGEVVARSAVEGRFSFVLDLSHFRKGELIRFMTDFLTTLYRLNRESMLLIVDEADTVAPQKPYGDEAKVLGAMQDVVRRGRARGLGVVMITQRPQVLNKDVLTQADILWALRMNHPKDLKAIKEWVDVHADPRVAKEMLASLPDLPTGTAWLWAPDMNILAKVPVRRRETFDSSRTPQPGEILTAPKVLAQVDLEKLGKEISATVQKVRENSPAALKQRIAELEAALRSAKPSAGQEAEMSYLEVANRRLGSQVSDLLLQRDRALDYAESLVQLLTESTPSESADLEEEASPKQVTEPKPVQAARAMPAVAEKVTAPPGLTGPQLKVLQSVAALHAVGIQSPERKHVALFSGYSNPRSGGFTEPTGQLVGMGYLQSASGTLALTPAGRKVAPPAAAATTADLHTKLQSLLSGPEWKILDYLIRLYPRSITRAGLAEKMGYSNPRSGGFTEPMGKLVSMGLASTPAPGTVVGTEMLFVNGRK